MEKDVVYLLQVQVNSVWATQKVYSIESNAKKALIDEEDKNSDLNWRIKTQEYEDRWR